MKNKSVNQLRLIVPILIAVLGSVVSATGTNTTWYVPGNYQSISNAVNAPEVNDGDTIVLNTNLWTECGIEITKSLTISGLGMTNTILQGAAARGKASNRIFQMNTANKALIIQNLTLQYGLAPSGFYGGGALLNAAGATTVQNCVLTMNDSLVNFTGGGAIAQPTSSDSPNAQLNLLNCLFSDNTAANNGGAIFVGSSVLIDGCSFVSISVATGSGGAMSTTQAKEISVRNSTFFGNRSTGSNSRGSAIQLGAKGTVTIYNCTVAANSAGYEYGAGLSANIPFSATSTIFAGNTPNEIWGVGPGADAGVLSNCLLQGNVSNTTNINCITGDPLLKLLAYNGGITPTLALSTGSPALEKGVNPANLSLDQRGAGYPRARGAAVDIGAVQFAPAP